MDILPRSGLWHILARSELAESDRSVSNLIVTGFSGTGKSIVAREVARRLDWDLVDTDEEVVKQSGRQVSPGKIYLCCWRGDSIM